MNTIPPSFNFKGDRQKSISLKAQARQFYNFVISQAELGGISFMSRTRLLPDGSSITVTTKKENIYSNRTGFIIINTIPVLPEELEDESLYLESGFIDFISTGKCTENAYRPGTLNYNAEVIAELDSPTPIQGKVKLKVTDLLESPFTGELLVDGQESLSVGCKEATRLPSITTPEPCDTTFSNGGYCGISLWARKTTMQKVPASLYTGKLRLFIQSMYGSTRDDLSYDGDKLVLTDQSGKVYTNPSDGTITLNHSGISSYWLYTIGDGGYALCYFDGADIVMIPLLLPKIASKFAEILALHPNKDNFKFYTKVEAYILAYAKPVYDSSLWVRISVTNPTTYGDPLSYGWHTNWKGDEANIVTFFAAVSGDRFTSNRYKLTIGQTESGGVISFTASISTEEAAKDWSNWTTGIKIFYYDESTQQMMALAKPGSFTPADFNFDSPIYCFTKLDTAVGECELFTVYAYNNKSAIASYNHDITVWPDNFEDIHYTDRRTYGAGAVQGKTGIKIVGPESHNYLVDVDSSHTTNNEFFIFENSFWSPQGAGITYYDGVGPSPWYTNFGWSYNGTQFGLCQKTVGSTTIYAFADWELGQYHKYRLIDNGSSSAARVIVEAPHFSCDSVMVGTEKTDNHSGSYDEQRSSSVGWVHRDARMSEAVYDGVWVRTGVVLDTASSHWSVKLMGGLTYQLPINNPVIDTVISSIPAGTTVYHTELNESVGSEDFTTVLSNSLIGDSRYFGATLSSPGTGTVDTVQASIQSGAKSNHTLYSQDYGFINNSSVGWA